jgi:hypothetical protein
MAQDQARPLNRLTPLRDDPARAWLSPAQRLSLRFLGWRKWALYWMGLGLFRLILLLVTVNIVAHTGYIPFAGYAPWFATAALLAATIGPMRRSVLRSQSARMTELVRRAPPSEALQVDEWAQLEAESDGRMVSLVGWVRARTQMVVADQPCVGLALPCQQAYPGVFESVHDFDLVDEQERRLSIQVTEGRLFGTPNLALDDGHQRRTLVASLNLPVGAVLAGWETYVLRDGDPVMVLGFKQTVSDPGQHGARQVPVRVTIGSAANQPLLIFPLDAERRPAPAAPEPPAPTLSFNWG